MQFSSPASKDVPATLALIVHHSAKRSLGCKASLLDLPRSFDGRRQRVVDVGDDLQLTHVLVPQAYGATPQLGKFSLLGVLMMSITFEPSEFITQMSSLSFVGE